MRILLLISVLLTGCATAAQRQGQQMVAGLQTAQAVGSACSTPINKDPKYTALTQHLSLSDPRQATLQQMTDKAFVTPFEAALLSDRHDRLLPCRNAYLTQVSAAVPAYGLIWDETYSQADRNLIDLVEKKETWGEYVLRARAIIDTNRHLIVEKAHDIDADLNRSHQQEIARRQAAAAVFANTLSQIQQQQIINNMNRPVTTNCNRIGNSVNCTTY